MLTNEELREIRNQIENQDPYMESADLAAKFLQAIDELLSLQSLPEMAEVDAEYEGCFDGADHAASSSDAVKRLADIARRAIALAESLAAELEAIRGAGDEEVEECAREAENGIGTDWYGDRKGCQNASEYLEKLKDISIARGRDRDAALKRVAELEEMLRLREMSGIDGKEPTDG